MRLLMRVSSARTANPAALLAVVVSLLGAPPSGADPLAPGESAWAPSFTFLAASSAGAPAPGESPETIPAPAPAELPACTSAIADDCITTVFEEPARPEVTQVAPAVLRLELPIRMPGLGHVNCYAIVDGEGATVVDPVLPGPGT